MIACLFAVITCLCTGVSINYPYELSKTELEHKTLGKLFEIETNDINDVNSSYSRYIKHYYVESANLSSGDSHNMTDGSSDTIYYHEDPSQRTDYGFLPFMLARKVFRSDFFRQKIELVRGLLLRFFQRLFIRNTGSVPNNRHHVLYPQ